MLTKKILKQILNVKHTAIDDVNISPEGVVFIDVHLTKAASCRCGICGKHAPRYDRGDGAKRLWRTCDWNTLKVYLRADEYRIKCPFCGVITAMVPWARHGSRFTYEFEQEVAWLAVGASSKFVSELMRISWNTVGPIIGRVKDALDVDPSRRFDDLIRIGVDETSYRKGHKYITVVINHDTGKVIWACKGHGKGVFSQFFELLTDSQRASIELVSGDGARWIQECIDRYCPNAKRCIDPFHVVEWANDALNQVRIAVTKEAAQTKASGTGKKPGRPSKDAPKQDTTARDLKGSRFALGKSPEHLTGNQQAQLEFIAKSNPKLYRAYLLKEKLRLIFHCRDVSTAKEELDSWIKWAQHCRIDVYVELQRKIRRHYDAILASIEHHLSNARIEAINNKIKLSIRMAYGFRNIDNMLALIMLRCSDLKVLLPWQQTEPCSARC